MTNNSFARAGAKRFKSAELATIITDPLRGYSPTYGSTTFLLNPQDQLLLEKGGAGMRALDLYLDLATDPHVFACIDKISQEIVSRDWAITPASDSEDDLAIAEWATKMLERLGQNAEDEAESAQLANSCTGGLDELTKALAFSMLTGYQIAEVLWALDESGKPYPQSVKPKDPRRFAFEADSAGRIYLKLLTGDNYRGYFLPKRKFIIHSYWAVSSDEPYGMSLGRQIYYPVIWKREAFTYWLTVMDKYADPLAIGRVAESATDDQISAFKSFLAGIGRETSAVLPEGFDISFISTNVSSSMDMFSNLITNCDKHISLAILGEAVTGEQVGSGLGSQREAVGNSIRIMKAKALSDSISTTITNTLLKWAVKYRFGEKAKVPIFTRLFEAKQDISLILQHFQTLNQLGFPISYEQVAELTGYKMDEEKLAKKPKSVSEILQNEGIAE